MDRDAIRDALYVLISQGVANWDCLSGLAFGLSFEGLDRAQVLDVFAGLFDSRYNLSEAQGDMVGDFCAHLLGQSNVADVVRLAGDPEDPDEFMKHVYSSVRDWKPPW